MCVRLMHERKPPGYRTFLQLLLDTELLDNSWAPVARDIKLGWSGGRVRATPRPAVAGVISLHMSLVKMMMQTYSEEARINGVEAASAVAMARGMQADMLRAIQLFTQYTQVAKQVGSGLSVQAFSGEYFTSTNPPQLHPGRVPSHDKLLLILIRFWLRLAKAALPQDGTIFPTLSLPSNACTKGAGILNVLHGCGGFINIEGDTTFTDTPKMLASLWERWVCADLRGRVLPGCCYWGCTNMSGFSEAVLSTRLCSGCKRVRYCCEGCQKGAWLEGHKEECKTL